MKEIFSLIFSIFFTLCLVIFFQVNSASADDIRKPVYAGSFYPKTRSELMSFIEQLTGRVKQTHVQHLPHTSLKALIMPHAGYIYSGMTAAHISLALKKNQFKKVIVMAPDHRVGFKVGAISDATAYETPLGLIPLNHDAATLRGNNDLFQSIPASDRVEHSVRDQKTIKMVLNLEAGKLLKRENAACGKIPILIVINMARRHGWQPILLHYSNSGDTAGDRSRVVGYAAIAFYGGSSMQNSIDSSHSLSEQQGQTLVKLARQAIAERLGKKSIEADPASMKDSIFQDHRGTFVTLTINKQLRGCIGNLDSNESILSGIKRNAINSAFHDPRFSPLKAHELDRVDIEISILTKPHPLEYRDSKDLLAKLRVNVDGVILRKGPASATFLPQVWKQLPKPEQFLSHLCMKAGLPADDWERSRLEILTYQVQYFEETK